MSKTELRKAQKDKKDEFYTSLTDIEKELKYYKKEFENKTVFLNCDDPEYSNFWKYFSMNFDHVKIKTVMATHYEAHKQSYYLTMYRDDSGVHTDIKTLSQNGDFRSPECIELLKEADIVCTNPPFSLFRDYIKQLVEYNKKFLIIGNINIITYKEVFPLFKDNKIWIGPSIHSGDREFRVPDDYPLNASGWRIDEEGNKYIRVKGVRWVTNLDYKERHDLLPLYKEYNPKEYPKYDNYDGINIDKTADIPADYDGAMGVPITFMDKYNPEQFEIIKFRKGDDDKDLCINGKCPYFRILIRKKK